jgi:hypothetical protein
VLGVGAVGGSVGDVVFVLGAVLGASPLEHAEVTNAARLATRRRFMRRG